MGGRNHSRRTGGGEKAYSSVVGTDDGGHNIV